MAPVAQADAATASASVSRFIGRLWRAALLDPEAYEEVEADRAANGEAFAAVVLSAAAMGVGSIANSGWAGIFWHTVVTLVGWYVWAYVTYLIGTRLLPHPATSADHGELLRTIGFSSAPGILRIGMLVPALALPLFTLCSLWMLISMVVAVRQALDYPHTLRAVAVCSIGFPVYAAGLVGSLLVLGPWPM